MESVLLAVALLGFGIGGYFVVGASRISLPWGPPAGPRERGKIEGAGGHALAVRQWPTPPEQEKPREKGGKSSRLAG